MNIRTITSWLVAVGLGLLVLVPAVGFKNTAHGAGKDIEKIGEKIQEKTD